MRKTAKTADQRENELSTRRPQPDLVTAKEAAADLGYRSIARRTKWRHKRWD